MKTENMLHFKKTENPSSFRELREISDSLKGSLNLELETRELREKSKFSSLPDKKTIPDKKTLLSENLAKSQSMENMKTLKTLLQSLTVEKISYPCMDKELRLRAISEDKAQIEAQTITEGSKTTLMLFNVPEEFESAFTLHELSEFIIAETIEQIEPKALRLKALENVAHFLNAYSLNQYDFILKTYNGVSQYVETDRLPSFEVEECSMTRKEYLFRKAQKSVEKSGIQFVNDLHSSNGQKCDGLFDERTHLISIEGKLSTLQKAIAIGHEFVHALNHSVLKRPSTHIIDTFLDYSNFLVEKDNLISIIATRTSPFTVRRHIQNLIAIDVYSIRRFSIEALKELGLMKSRTLREIWKTENLEKSSTIPENQYREHGEHGKNVKELNLSSIPSNGLEIASYGLSVPKTVIKNKTKVNEMVSERIKTKAQSIESKKTLKAQELVISSKKVVESKKEAIRMDKKANVVKKRIVKKKAIQRKQRKGKSLLTAFRINRMTQRFGLNMNRGELRGKYV